MDTRINQTTLNQRQLKPFAGYHSELTDYLTDEDSAPQSVEERQMMQQIAALNRLNASLCHAICTTEDAARIIDNIWAEARNYIPEASFIEWIEESLPTAQRSAWLDQILEHHASVSTQSVPVPALQEPLSERELDVLKLLASDLSGPEISAQLFISINTFRTHTKNLYSKLQVNSRRSAVRRAKELSIL
ncbi:LuxR C-terminal-related transcriptional regulator [Reinekea sp. G2M2-21]|uniref:LuxR C-terminal-related transcriptional regulator n=1 Tax=Reinekea sp. G2M2-21 TaxID=2788942 RepID=UPI001E31AA33|nr:LuxR C-terminal-related transcriptional regulator [Reinekea sp. G2M2-21]